VARRGGLPFRIYQEPIVAAGQPWTDQVRLLVTTDLWNRYCAMRGNEIRLQTGWACHGLQVEVAAEQLLATDTARYAVARDYAIAQFNTVCRDVAAEGVRRGELLAERLGVWLDPAGTYASCTAQATAAVWGAIHRLWQAGKLTSGCHVVPVCPRCATPLSTAEATRHTAGVEARSIWVRLPWDGEAHAYLLAWAGAPWMLAGMVALAAHPDANYALVELAGSEGGGPPERLLLAENALERTLAGEFSLVRQVRGKALAGVQYRPPFTFLPADEGTGRVLVSKDVPQDRGTGLMALTPAFDAPSLQLAREHGLPVPELLDDRGNLGNLVMRWRGLSPLDAEPFFIDDLRSRGLLFKEETSAQIRGLCPYCDTPLLPLSRNVWQAPGPRGPWTISRDRAWGVPLPVWVCGSCGEQTCVAGLDELAHRTGLNVEQVEPHRPAVDGLTFPCESCGGTMRRVDAVVDAAFEAAVLPQVSWPSHSSLEQVQERPLKAHPGRLSGPVIVQNERAAPSLAVGLGDRQRGWLAELDEVAALLQWPRVAEQTVAVREQGMELVRDHDQDAVRNVPADALRWAVYLGIAPEQAERDFLDPVWQLAHQLLVNPAPSSDERAGNDATGELLDRWLKARLHQAILLATGALDAGDARYAASSLADLVHDLSSWRALRQTGDGRDAMDLLSRLLAPFVPHLAEAIHRRLGNQVVESVSLGDWPVPDPAWAAPDLLATMATAWRLAALGETARRQAGIEPGRSLPQALVAIVWGNAAQTSDLDPFNEMLAEMLHVAKVRFAPDANAYLAWKIDLKPGEAEERDVPPVEIRTALAELEPEMAADLAAQLGTGLSAGLPVGDRAITLLPDEVAISVQAEPGWAAAVESGQLVVLQLA
jgi:isoleucyl-tRNA synthetase